MVKPKHGVIESIENYQQKVVCDNGEVMWMAGIARIQNANVGDKVTLTYISRSTFGLWFGTVDKS